MLKSRRKLAYRAALVFMGFALSFLLPVVSASAQSVGRKFAVVIGINHYPYLPEKKQLRWAVTDAGNARRMLVEEFYFPPSNVAMLSNTEATRAGILMSLRNALAKVGAGDVFVLYYSGHGTLFPDSKSEVLDETQLIEEVVDGETQRLRRLLRPERFDSAICPSDVAGLPTSGKGWGNLILDDELFDLFTEFTQKGCEVVLLADSCNSGSLGRDIAGGGDDRPKLIEPELALGKSWHDITAPRVQRTLVRATGDLNGRFIAFTAAKDNQLAWESGMGGGGYFTQALVAAAAGKNNIATFECLFRILKRNVKELKSIQEPQMDTRFFRSAPTNILFLNYAEPSRLKVLVKITDTEERNVPDAAFAVLRSGVLPKARIEEGDALLLGHSDFGGLYDSGCPQVEGGTYWVVAVKKGYKVFEERLTIEANAPGVAVLRIKLARL